MRGITVGDVFFVMCLAICLRISLNVYMDLLSRVLNYGFAHLAGFSTMALHYFNIYSKRWFTKLVVLDVEVGEILEVVPRILSLGANVISIMLYLGDPRENNYYISMLHIYFYVI